MKGGFEDAVSVITTLKSAGHSAFMAGGCVRDILLGHEPNDYDVATSASPTDIISLFEKTIPVGIAFGVVRVILDGSRELEVATFRADGQYSDGRRPDSVEFKTNAEDDVRRRDFTINALLMDENRKVIDYVGGERDLRNKILSAVGDPTLRFTEDALRMMRAIRFALRFDLKIDGPTWDAIVRLAPSIKNISRERITDELTKIFSCGRAEQAYLMVRRSTLWTNWFGGDLCPDHDDDWRRMLALSYVRPGDPFTLVLALLFAEEYEISRGHLLGKLTLTNIQQKTFYSILERQEKWRRFLLATLADQRKMLQWEDLDLVRKFVNYQRDGGRFRYTGTYTGAEPDTLQRVVEFTQAMGWPGPLVTGNHLIEMGFTPGPVFTQMLDLIRDHQLEGTLSTMEEVKPFIISRFPATPRKLEDGTFFDDTGFRRLAAECVNCHRLMHFDISKTPDGKYVWKDLKNEVNIRSYRTSRFIICKHCGTRRGKGGFVEVKV